MTIRLEIVAMLVGHYLHKCSLLASSTGLPNPQSFTTHSQRHCLLSITTPLVSSVIVLLDGTFSLAILYLVR